MSESVLLNQKKVRFDWLDAIKAVAIVYVIFGHLGANGIEFYATFTSVVKLPLFFAASGFVFSLKKLDNTGSYIKNRTFRLILSYIILTFTATILSGLCTDTFTLSDFSEILKACVYNTVHLKKLWFLPVLFIIDLLFFIVMKITKCNYKIIGIISLFCIAIGYITAKLGSNINFVISSVIISFPCYVFGFYYKKFIMNIDKKKKIIMCGICFLFYVILPLYFYFVKGKALYLNIHDNSYTNYFLNTIQIYTGLIFYFVIFEYMKLPKFILAPILYIGKNTLYFYAYHLVMFNYIMLVIKKIFCSYMTVDLLKGNIPGRFIYLGLTVLCIVLLFPLCMFNNKFLPVTVGKKMTETNCIFLKLKGRKNSNK